VVERVASADTFAASIAADAAVAPEPWPFAVVDDPAALAVVAERGGRFEDLVGPSGWRPVRAALRKAVRAVAARDRNAGESVRGHSHRLFHLGWLDDPRLELIGITFRSERLPVDESRCGDLRLVYRLAYRQRVGDTELHSRLPMTVLVELQGRERNETGCADEARRWTAPGPLSGAALGETLMRGPLADRLHASQVHQVLVNAQTVRWPSAVRPDLGGHAEYLMLAFRPDPGGGDYRSGLLENMPDVDRLRRDRALRQKLVDWIGAHLDSIDEGSAILPDEFLAREALSVTPRGLSRRANRPFRSFLEADDLAGMPLSGRERIASPEALLRRLDDMSCVGCHQSRTIAGFHWLGVDGDEVAPGNALFVSRSGPLLGDGRRRNAIVLDLAGGRRPDFGRPFAERDDDDGGGIGAHCGLGDPGFAGWRCAEGLVCDPYDAPADDAVVGVCKRAGGGRVGEACEVVAIAPHRNGHRDRARGARIEPCAQGVCNVNRTGFPGGMCTTSCATMGAEGTCGAIAQLTPFNNCLARKEAFPECLAKHVSPAGLRACDEAHLCRDDYICARTPEGKGGCIPPYFLFQLRVDGHP
jgi:hypothetical protein